MHGTERGNQAIQAQVDQFIRHCLNLCEYYKTHNIDYYMAGESIERASDLLPAHVHPMIMEIAFTASYLAEDYGDEETKQSKWNHVCRIVDDYANNRWAPTIWSLIANYNVTHNNEQDDESISARVNRIHGNTEIETTSDTLRTMLTNLSQKVDSNQTDEWYIHNLARLLPKEATDLVLTWYEVSEQLKPAPSS